MGQNGFSTKLKKAAAAMAFACLGTLGATPAFAVVEPAFYAWEAGVWTPFEAAYNQFVEEVDNQFFAINTYLSEIYTYMISGEGDTGTGIIGAVNANMNKIWSEQRPYMENMTGQTASWDRRNMLDSISGTAIMARAADPRACSELPVMAASRAVHGGGGGARAKGGTETKVAQAQGGTGLSDISHAADIFVAHESKYCSAEDVSYTGAAADRFGSARNAFGCSATGTMPDGDNRVQSVFVPAHDYVKAGRGDAAEIGKSYSLTYDAAGTGTAQSDAADISIRNMTASFSPNALSKDVEGTPAGKALLARVKVFNDRVSPAVMALASLKASRSSVNFNAEAAGGPDATWASEAARVYKTVFPPNTPVPAKPSEMELTRFEVARRYLDYGAGSWLEKLGADTPDQVAVESAQTLALLAHLQYETMVRTEQTNALLISLLAQSVNPVTKQDIDLASQMAARGK